LSSRAYLDLRRGQWQEAKGTLTDAIKFDRGDAAIFFNRGYAEERLGDTADAAADYAAARAINPEIDVMQKRFGIVPGNTEIKLSH
jgi:tetratricopeptide (TPR) repeat protein